MRDLHEEDPREVEASKFRLNYIGLEGNIACLDWLAMEVSNEPFIKAIAAIGKMYWRRLSLSGKLKIQEDAMDLERTSYQKIPIHPASDVACRLGGTQKENKSLFSLLLEIESRMHAETRNEKIDQLFKRSKKREHQYQYSRVDNLSRYCE